jgi:hypothetical protein
MNWLCRTIGHKWITKLRMRIDGRRFESLAFFPCCLRCGEPSPDILIHNQDIVGSMVKE